MDNIYAPIVKTVSSVVPKLGTIKLSSLFSVTDFDLDSTVTRIRIRDNKAGGGNFVRGVDSLAANTWHQFSFSQLGVLGYRGGPDVAKETYSIQVFDGKFWSNISSNIITSGKSKAVVTAKPGRVTPDNMLRIDRLFSVTDADGDRISRYMFVDRTANAGGGRLFVGAEEKAQARWFIVEAGDLSKVVYRGAAQGREVEQIGVMAWDGYSWSKTVEFEMATSAAPIVMQTTEEVLVNQRKRASAIFSTSDADGDPIKFYFVADYRLNSDGGYWEYMGAKMPSAKFFKVPAANLSQLYYVGAATGPQSESVGVQVYDGYQVSELTNFVIRSVVPPVVTGRDAEVKATHYLNFATGGTANTAGQMAPGTAILDYMDADGDVITDFLFVDRRNNVNGGYFMFKGERMESAKWFSVQESELSELEYVGGSWGPQSEEIGVMARANGDWSEQDAFVIDTLQNIYRPDLKVFSVTAQTGVVMKLSGLFIWSDMDGDRLRTFSFYDPDGAAESGYFSVDGVKQDANTWITLDWDSLGSVKYHLSDVSYTESIAMVVWDGRNSSLIETADIKAIERPVIEAIKNDVSVDTIERIDASSFFTQLDPGPMFTEYQVYDENTFFRSGRLELDGVDLEQGVMHTLTADEFSRLKFKGAETDYGRQFDPMLVRATNGVTGWSEFERINVTTDPVGPDALVSGAAWAVATPKTVLTYSFIDGNSPHPAPDYYVCQPEPDPDDECNTAGEDKPLNQAQREAIREVLGYYASLANFTFVEVAQSDTAADATLLFGAADLPGGVGAWAYLPSGDGLGSKPGDVWFDTGSFDPQTNFDVGLGSQFRSTAIHELGHAFGFKHPFSESPVLSVFTDFDYLTQMSYTHNSVHNRYDPYADAPTTPMLYDAMELQRIYGANMGYRTGDDDYGNLIDGSEPHFVDNTEQHQSLLWDAGGWDTFNYSNHTADESIDIREGAWSTINGVAQSVMIAYNTVIENARGGIGNDILRGNEITNLLFGNDGDDTLIGGGDNDVNRGGGGNDTYVWNLGDGRDTIREEGMGGIDIVEFYDTSGAIDSLEDDFVFRRMEENDFRIDLTLNQAEAQGTVSVINFVDAASTVELMKIYDALGNQIGNTIDLTSIFDTATNAATSYRVTDTLGANGGYIAMAVT